MLLATAPALADADTYRLDPVHTRVLFTIDHAGYSQAMGTVSGSEDACSSIPTTGAKPHWTSRFPCRD